MRVHPKIAAEHLAFPCAIAVITYFASRKRVLTILNESQATGVYALGLMQGAAISKIEYQRLRNDQEYDYLLGCPTFSPKVVLSLLGIGFLLAPLLGIFSHRITVGFKGRFLLTAAELFAFKLKRSYPLSTEEYVFSHNNPEVVFHPHTIRIKEGRGNLKLYPYQIFDHLGGVLTDANAHSRRQFQENPFLEDSALYPQFSVGFIRVEGGEMKDEIGADGGGVTREYFDELMKEFISHKTEGNAFFVLDDKNKRALPQDPQIGLGEKKLFIGAAFEGLGKVFAFVYNRPIQPYELTTLWSSLLRDRNSNLYIGDHFQPVLFNAILSLTAEEIDTPFQNLSKEAQMKMARALLVEGDDNGQLLKVVDWLSKSEYTAEEMQEIENYKQDVDADTLEEAFKETSISKALWPIHTIARGMKELCVPPNVDQEINAYWDNHVRNIPYINMSDKIQGKLDRNALDNAIILGQVADPVQREFIETRFNWLKEWIRDEATEEELKQFLKTQTGVTSCPPEGVKITVLPKMTMIEGPVMDPFPKFQTCEYILFLPTGLAGDGDYHNFEKEDFLKCLKAAISGAHFGGFSTH
ncbi:MAG: hypothetical protein KDK76_01630 [Chlamydiia bacterium]|nr:hypothetical protein [Chlamydiia bacterium]